MNAGALQASAKSSVTPNSFLIVCAHHSWPPSESIADSGR
jgi:hypothetical protein